ncbi:MAG: EscU/YscU/HrcU family type III secretion system export apparatus switch protein [Porticoccaceae bacterium]
MSYSGVGAPRVVAKGEGDVAAKITEIAEQAGVAMVEDGALATVLLQVPLGDEIPEALYVAIAEILAHIYRLGEFVDSYD